MPANLQNLKSKALTGSAWAILEKFSLQIVQFVVSVVLARLLEPRDYGLIAITAIFTGISSAITDGGFEKTLIRETEITPLQINSVFYLNAFLGLGMMAVLFFSAPALAAFFNEPALIPILRVTSLGLFINSLGQIQRVLLMKELHFKKISLAQILGSLTGGLTGIVMACNGFGVWALVWSGLVMQSVMVLLFWIRSDWYPKWMFSLSSVRHMWRYGSSILLSSLLFFTMLQFNTFIIGKLFPKSELGLFNRGGRLPDFIISLIQSVILKMAFPLFVKVQDHRQQLEQVVRKTVRATAFVSLPLLALLLVNAHDITIVLFTAKWSGSIIFLELFCLAAIFDPFVAIYRELILAKGKARLFLYVYIITSLAEIVAVLLLAHYGILYIVWATIAGKAVQYFTYMGVTSRHTGIPWQRQLKWLEPYIFLSVITGVAIKTLDYPLQVSGLSTLITLLLKLGIGGLVYLGMAWLAKLEELSFIRNIYDLFGKKLAKMPQSLLFPSNRDV
jgi:O-antigen/teichoic acid export membrane protein